MAPMFAQRKEVGKFHAFRFESCTEHGQLLDQIGGNHGRRTETFCVAMDQNP